ncbi:MAG: hypothetical protein H0T70_00740 [Acidimicrobiia bacterium]|nr:hypothetical protein [Acidimicrobiia bacterium]
MRLDSGVTKQSGFTIVAPVEADKIAALTSLLDEIGSDIKGNRHLRLAELEKLHYASFVVFEPEGSDPFLLFEGNIDGSPRDFLEQLVAVVPAAVDLIYGHCAGYVATAATDPVAAVRYLTSRDLGVGTLYIAWRGRDVADICREQELRNRLGEVLDQEARTLAGQTPEAIRSRLRQVVEHDPSLAWARTVPPRPFLVTYGGWVFGALAAAPGLALAPLASTAVQGPNRRRRLLARVALLIIGGLMVGAGRARRRHEKADVLRDAARPDDWETEYARWSGELSHVVRRENVQGQNHLASITQVKEGRFRLATLRAVLGLVDGVAALISNRGDLSGIASIHFARWVLTADKRHLIFLSNFDGSWERYLDDFIDLASEGLTAIWTNSDNRVGFPETRWLLQEGARDEQRFKAFARVSQAPTLAWYSAYPDLTVENIANNRAIREGLFGSVADPEAWLRRF